MRDAHDLRSSRWEAGTFRPNIEGDTNMTTNPIAQKMEQMVAAYFEACNKVDARAIASCFAPGIVHYFPHAAPIRGGDSIGEMIVQIIRNVGGQYFIDRMLSAINR